MRKIALAMLLFLAAASASAAPLRLPVHYPGDDVAAPCYAGDVIEVQLAPGAARAAQPFGARATRAGLLERLGVASVDATAAALGARFEPEFIGEVAPDPFQGRAPDFTGFQIVHLAAGTRLEDALARFRALPEVASAWPIAELPTSSVPNDSLFALEHWLYRASSPRHDIRAPEAWDVESGDTSIVVAILDTGVLPYHPDLGGTVAGGHGNLWVNWAEMGGAPGVDDDGNGFVDDFYGWDFVATSGTDSARADPGEDAQVPDNDPNDYAGHGTMMAGIIGAIADNTHGIAGVVPRVRLMPVRIGWFPRNGVHPGGNVRMDFAAQAIRYATREGASVLNCSWSSDYTAGLDSAVTEATRAGVTVVNASGNFNSPAYLGSRDDVVSVAATDSTDHYWIGNVTGPWLDLAADALNMTSTSVVSLAPDSIGSRQPDYASGFDGTSFAAPQVSGAVALLQSQAKHRGHAPLTPLGARLRLVETGDDVRALNPGVPDVAPRLNLLRALTDRATSTAVRALGSTVGPAAVLHYNNGRTLVVYAMSNQCLVAYDGATADTAWIAALPGRPVGNLAAGRLGVSLGAAFFVGTANGQVAGIRDDGTVLSGWPRTGLGAGNQMYGGMAMGDLDGDGVLEVVSMGANGRLWAWHADGTLLPGFPFVTGALGASEPAIANLDGRAGAEILCMDGASVLHAIDYSATELWQWAAPSNAAAPVVTALGRVGAPLGILVPDPTGVTALDSTGAPGWNAPVDVNLASSAAMMDADGDGVNELVVSAGAPSTLARVDSAGTVRTDRGWPVVIGADPMGPLVVGPLRAGHPCVGFYAAPGFVAFDDSGQVVRGFPKAVPGAGFSPTLGDLRGDGATRVAAGSASDSNVVVLDSGALTWDARFASWPTPRGNPARTGSTLYAASPAILDVTPPAAVRDLAGAGRSISTIALAWTATGDDSVAGRAARVDLRRSATPITAGTFGLGLPVAASAPGVSGTTDSVLVAGLAEGATWYFALIAYDAEGNASALSNVAVATTATVAPGGIADLSVISIADTVATLRWTATGDNGGAGRPASYDIAGDLAPFDSAGFDAAAIRYSYGSRVDAGGIESTQVPGLSRGRRWYFAVRAVDHVGVRSPISNLASVVVPTGGAVRGRVGAAIAARLRPSRVPVVFDWQGADEGGVQSISLHDLSGRLVRRIRLGSEPGGSWEWDGRDGESRLLPAGLYLVRLASGGRHAEARVVLLR